MFNCRMIMGKFMRLHWEFSQGPRIPHHHCSNNHFFFRYTEVVKYSVQKLARAYYINGVQCIGNELKISCQLTCKFFKTVKYSKGCLHCAAHTLSLLKVLGSRSFSTQQLRMPLWLLAVFLTRAISMSQS